MDNLFEKWKTKKAAENTVRAVGMYLRSVQIHNLHLNIHRAHTTHTRVSSIKCERAEKRPAKRSANTDSSLQVLHERANNSKLKNTYFNE